MSDRLCEYCGEPFLTSNVSNPEAANYKRYCRPTCAISAWKGRTYSGKPTRTTRDKYLELLVDSLKENE